jgi:hypothetical protein
VRIEDFEEGQYYNCYLHPECPMPPAEATDIKLNEEERDFFSEQATTNRISFVPCDEEGIEIEKPALDFQFLYWKDKVNNFTRFTGETVISGPFSGCLMTSVKKNGHHIIAHIHTEPGVSDAKGAWDAFIKRGGCDEVRVFNPPSAYAVLKNFIPMDKRPYVCGVVTNTERFFSLIFANNSRFLLFRKSILML